MAVQLRRRSSRPSIPRRSLNITFSDSDSDDTTPSPIVPVPEPGTYVVPGRAGDRFCQWLCHLKVVSDPDPAAWDAIFRRLRAEYLGYVHTDGRAAWHTASISPSRTFESFGGDRLMSSIALDVVRTMKLICFLPVDMARREHIDRTDPSSELQEYFRRLERILFAFARRWPMGYIQGLNDLTAVLYFVVLDHFFDSSTGRFAPGDQDLYEALTFCMLQNLIVEGHMDALLSNFNEGSGIMCHLQSFEHQLVKLLPDEAAVLTGHGITPIHYAIRWFTLLFAQEHDLPCVLTLWDNIFAHFNDLADYLIYVGIAHIWAASDKFDPGDYRKTLNAVQAMHWDIDIEGTIRYANRLFEQDFPQWRIEKTLPDFGAKLGIYGWIQNMFGRKPKGRARQRWTWSASNPQQSPA